MKEIIYLDISLSVGIGEVEIDLFQLVWKHFTNISYFCTVTNKCLTLLHSIVHLFLIFIHSV